MKLNNAELGAFRDRCHRAAIRGYGVAHADLYMAAMVDEAGDVEPPPGVAAGSAGHLAATAQATLDVRSGTKPKGKAKAATKPKAAPPPPPEPEEPVVVEDEDELPYEDWDRAELYARAQDVDLSGRSNMSKDELIEALEAHDEEE